MTCRGRGSLGLLDLPGLLRLGRQARLLDLLGLALQRDLEALGRLHLVDHRDPPLLEFGRQDEIADQDLLEHHAALGQALARRAAATAASSSRFSEIRRVTS